MKKLLAILILIIILLPVMPANIASATVGPLVREMTVLVDDEAFSIWGVGDDFAVSRVRLRDLAYVLSGTPAQFDIREAENDAFSYWIIRGQPYTPDGSELQPIDYYQCEVKWYMGFRTRTIVGIDGITEPETFIDVSIYKDDYDLFFPLYQLGRLLGFSIEWSRIGYFVLGLDDYYVEGADYVISTKESSRAKLPIQSLAFMELMRRIAGFWVDSAHFYNEIIDESVVWPVQLGIAQEGYGVRFFSWLSVVPMRTETPPYLGLWYPVSMTTLGEGIAELIMDDYKIRPWYDMPENHDEPINSDGSFRLYNRRILVDTTASETEEIDEIFLIVGDTSYRMVRPYRHLRDPRRYTVSGNEYGHIILRYVLGQNVMAPCDYIQIFRSEIRGDVGDLIFSKGNLNFNDRILFEFIDTTDRFGYVYYYCIASNKYYDIIVPKRGNNCAKKEI